MIFDWADVTATMLSTIIGGVLASRVATYQTRATLKAEERRRQQAIARDMLETIDSYVHIAFRGETTERQRLDRRLRTLSKMILPEAYGSTDEHLLAVARWHSNTSKPKGTGFSATTEFFDTIKQRLFAKFFPSAGA